MTNLKKAYFLKLIREALHEGKEFAAMVGVMSITLGGAVYFLLKLNDSL